MDVKSIQDILKFVNKSDLTEVEIEEKEFRLRITKKSSEPDVIYSALPAVQAAPQAPVVQQAAHHVAAPQADAPARSEAKAEEKTTADDNLYTFKSPMIGTFYRSPGPDKESFVTVGDSISKGSVLCIVEAMKLFNEIESEVEGKIVKILVEDATPVEYDQPLFLIEV